MPEAVKNVQLIELFAEIRHIALGSWRYRWPAIALTWAGCLVGWLIVLAMPNVYEASARLVVDTESSLDPVLRGLAVDADAEKLNEAMFQVRSLSSRPNMERIAEIAGLIPVNASPDDTRDLVQGLQEEVEVALNTDQILSIRYQNSDKIVAMSIVSQLMDGFIDGFVSSNRMETEVAQEFLEQKLNDYGELLVEAERRLAEFKRKNVGYMPDDGQDYYFRLQQEEEKLASIELEYRQTRERRSALAAQLEGESPVFGLMAPAGNESQANTAVGRQAAEYEEELARLRMNFTESHPDIVRIKAILEDLRTQQREMEPDVSGQQAVRLEQNTVYQNMKIQLSSIELDLSDLALQRANQQKVVAELRSKVDAIPEVEANLTKLNRDYDINKAQYDALLQRLESSRLTEAAEEQRDVEFRIIDPPSVASDPAGPPRVLLMTMVLILSIGSSLGMALLTSYSRPVFYSIRSLEDHFHVPVLGGIERVDSIAESTARRFSAILFGAASASVLGIYGLCVFFNQAVSSAITGLVRNIGILV